MKYNLSRIMSQAWQLFRKLGLSFSECLRRAWASAKAEPVNAARIAAACGGWAFRPRDMPASWARRCAHNASGPVVFTPEKISGVCGRGSPPSCKLPMVPGPDGGGGMFSAWGKNLARRMAPGLGEHKPEFSSPGGRVRPSDPRRCASVACIRTPAPKPPQQIAQCKPIFLRSDTPFPVHNRPVLLRLSRLLVLYPAKNRL